MASDQPNPNPNPMEPPSPGNKRPRSPSLDQNPSEAKQLLSEHVQQSLEKEIGTEEDGTDQVIKEVMHKTSLTTDQEPGESEEEKDGKENQGIKEEKEVNEENLKEEKETESANESVNSSEGGVSFVSETLVKMIMTDGPPLHTMETGMYPLFRSLRPDVQLPSRTELEKDCIKLHQMEKSRLKKILKKHRVCLSTETWLDECKMCHMSIRAHWINEKWDLCDKVLTFRWVPPVNEEDREFVEELGEIWEKCLKDWGIESVLTVTVGKSYTEDGAVEYLKNRTKDKIGTVLGHEFLHLTSCAYVMSEVVKAGLEAEKETVRLIRSTVSFVGSGERYEHFKECARKENLEHQGRLFVSMEPMWDSVYMMLEKATKLQKAFERLMKEDSLYLSCFYPPEEDEEDYDFWGNKIEKEIFSGPPTEEDWENARRLAKLLRLFYKVMRRLSDPLCTTSTFFLKEVIGVRIRLSQLSRDEDRSLSSLAECMKKKFDEYWGNLFNLNPLLYVAEVLDPRKKLKYLRFYLTEIGTESTLVESFVERIEDTLTRLFLQYLEFEPEESLPCSNLDPGYVSMEEDYSMSMTVHFSKLMAKERKAERTLELKLYLTASCETDDPFFDILDWWKENCMMYPVLSKMAKDVLAVPVTASFYEQAFSTNFRELASHKSRLSDEIREALICGQDWFMFKPPPADFKEAVIDEMAIDDEEEIEHDFY